jgi:hypothetical protein
MLLELKRKEELQHGAYSRSLPQCVDRTAHL